MNEEDLKRKLVGLRIQARNQVIILVSSLIFIFLWMSVISFLSHYRTFSTQAIMRGSEALGVEASSASIVPIALFLAIFFTCFYLVVLIKLAPSLKKNLEA